VPKHLPIVITRLRTLLLQYCYSGLSRWVFEAKRPTSYLIVFTKTTHRYPCPVSALQARLGCSYIGLGRPPATAPHYPTLLLPPLLPRRHLPVWLLGPNENVERTQSL